MEVGSATIQLITHTKTTPMCLSETKTTPVCLSDAGNNTYRFDLFDWCIKGSGQCSELSVRSAECDGLCVRTVLWECICMYVRMSAYVKGRCVCVSVCACGCAFVRVACV